MVGVREDNSTVLGGEGCAMGSPCGVKLGFSRLCWGARGGWRPTEKRILKLFGQRGEARRNFGLPQPIRLFPCVGEEAPSHFS